MNPVKDNKKTPWLAKHFRTATWIAATAGRNGSDQTGCCSRRDKVILLKGRQPEEKGIILGEQYQVVGVLGAGAFGFGYSLQAGQLGQAAGKERGRVAVKTIKTKVEVRLLNTAEVFAQRYQLPEQQTQQSLLIGGFRLSRGRIEVQVLRDQGIGELVPYMLFGEKSKNERVDHEAKDKKRIPPTDHFCKALSESTLVWGLVLN